MRYVLTGGLLLAELGISDKIEILLQVTLPQLFNHLRCSLCNVE